MEITLDLLLYFIRDLKPVIFKKSANAVFFSGVQQYLPEEQEKSDIGKVQEWTEQPFYVSDLCALRSSKNSLRANMTFIVPLENTDDPLLQELPCGLIAVEGHYQVPYLMNRMINLFNTLANWDKNMHIAALEGKSIQAIVDLSEEILEHPVLVFDAGFDVLAYTQNMIADLANFQDTIQNGYTDSKTMDLVNRQNILSKLKEKEMIIAPAVEDEAINNVYMAFSNDGNIFGYAALFLESKEPESGYLDLIRIFVSNLNFCMKRDYENHIFGQMLYETFLRNLLNRIPMSEEQINEQIQNIDWLKENDHFVLGLLEFSDHNNVSLTFLARQLDHALWDVKPFLYDNKIGLLRILEKCTEKEIFSDWEKDNLKTLLSGYEYAFGISNAFASIKDLCIAFEQAECALQFGSAEGRKICAYEDYAFFDLLKQMEKTRPVEFLKMGLYKELQEYDRQRGSRYLQQILTYVKCDCNATHAATQLYLHRNTILKTVDFVETKWNTDVRQENVKWNLRLGEMVDRYLQIKEKDKLSEAF